MLYKIDSFLGSIDSSFNSFFETYPNIAELFPLFCLFLSAIFISFFVFLFLKGFK